MRCGSAGEEARKQSSSCAFNTVEGEENENCLCLRFLLAPFAVFSIMGIIKNEEQISKG